MPRNPGRPFLQIPGPTNTPLRILAAIAEPTIDHRGPKFQELGLSLLQRIRSVFQTAEPVIVYPASGTGAWEAALVNTLSPGDRVLMAETGHFATLWKRLAERLGLAVDLIPGDWRSGVDPDTIEQRLRDDKRHAVKAVAIVHNETSTGVASDVAAVRRSIDRARHPALYLVDAVSSLGSIDYRHDEWGVDVTVAGSQKGLMLPPGLGFNALSQKALLASRSARLPRAFWDWQDILASNATGFFPYTPSTNLLQGLSVALDMLEEEGLAHVFRRHRRAAEAVRACVRHWGFDIQAANPSETSASLTAVRLPEGVSADALRAEILARSSVSLGNGLGRLADRVFRIGHLGDFNDPTLLGALASIEIGLMIQGVRHTAGGVGSAMTVLARNVAELESAAA
jgi:alanine-glyoxylate transaminase/serine-glyoxylate transaminase/serine-pyruvate transaminase